MPAVFSSILAAILLGIARASINALAVLATGKTPTGPPVVLREKALVQADLARAEAKVRSGRAYLFGELEVLWRNVLAGREVTLHQPALVQFAAGHTVNLMASDGSMPPGLPVTFTVTRKALEQR
jgi:hypothetical protein